MCTWPPLFFNEGQAGEGVKSGRREICINQYTQMLSLWHLKQLLTSLWVSQRIFKDQSEQNTTENDHPSTSTWCKHGLPLLLFLLLFVRLFVVWNDKERREFPKEAKKKEGEKHTVSVSSSLLQTHSFGCSCFSLSQVHCNCMWPETCGVWMVKLVPTLPTTTTTNNEEIPLEELLLLLQRWLSKPHGKRRKQTKDAGNGQAGPGRLDFCSLLTWPAPLLPRSKEKEKNFPSFPLKKDHVTTFYKKERERVEKGYLLLQSLRTGAFLFLKVLSYFPCYS